MDNIFSDAYLGKAYNTRGGKIAIFIRKDTYGKYYLETDDHPIFVRDDGTDVFAKIGYESSNDIVLNNNDKFDNEELKHIIPTDYGNGYNQLLEFVYNLGYTKGLKQNMINNDKRENNDQRGINSNA